MEVINKILELNKQNSKRDEILVYNIFRLLVKLLLGLNVNVNTIMQSRRGYHKLYQLIDNPFTLKECLCK